MVDALVEDVGINGGLVGEMMGGQNDIAELIWFVRWLETAFGEIKITAE